jgi:translocation and assembly module TamA
LFHFSIFSVKRLFGFTFILVLAAFGPVESLEAKEKPLRTFVVCPGRVELIHSSNINFSKNEKNFLCGDPDVEAWSSLPLDQVQYHMGTFLEGRGYFQPRFEVVGGVLKVYPGNTVKITKVELTGDPPAFLQVRRRWKTLGTRLTPGSLSALEGWVKGELNSQGYPCPVLKSRANVASGEVIIEVEPGPFQDINSITQESVPGLDMGTLRRYDAFQLDKPFNDDLLTLSALRLEAGGLLQNTFFTWQCGPRGAELMQRTYPGKSRLIRIGFGADTEQYFIIRGSWAHNRLGQNGSNLVLSWFGSYIQQKLDLTGEWYAFSPLSRWFLFPKLSFNHERESDYHFLDTNLFFGLARTYDNQKFGVRFQVGPNLNFTYTFSGSRPGWTKFLSLLGEVDWMDHDYEIFLNDPREGYRVLFKAALNSDVIFSDISAQGFRLNWHYYYNLKNLDPPLLIFGWRGGFGSTHAPGDELTRDLLPPNFKYFLGGNRNLRGFGRQELPPDPADLDAGARTAAFLSFEIRLANVIPFGIQPIAFFDIGVLGDSFMDFDAPVYYSPGGGLRVASPFGVFRTTFAHGYKTGPDGDPGNTHFQFLFSFGEEF